MCKIYSMTHRASLMLSEVAMSALAGEDEEAAAALEGSNRLVERSLDCESVSISSSTTSNGGKKPNGARQILGRAIPGIRSHSRGASCEKSPMENIPEQLRTPKVPQVRRMARMQRQ